MAEAEKASSDSASVPNPEEASSDSASVPNPEEKASSDSASVPNPSRFSRRGLLRSGGVGAAGLTLGGAASRTATAAAQSTAARGAPNVLLIVVDGMRSDFVSAYDDPHELADTPNIDELCDGALRFEMAIPESMPAMPARRAILTGMKSFPFRDWKPTDGFADFPGWTRVLSHQPLLTEVLKEGGVTTRYITDNPLLEDDRFEGAHRKPGGSAPAVTQGRRWVAPVVPEGAEGVERNLERVVDSGIEALRELKSSKPFFLAVDAFDRTEASDPTPVYATADALREIERDNREADSEAVSYGNTEEVNSSVQLRERVREAYRDEMKAVDEQIGRLLDALEREGLDGDTVIYLVSAGTTALGEHGVFGTAAAAGHEEVYRVAYVIRDPDGRRAGDAVRYYASTHDVGPTVLSYMGLTIPGKMEGEDLTAFFDEDDPAPRWHFTTQVAGQVVVGDRRYVLVTDVEGLTKRLYDTEPDDHEEERGDEDDYSPRTEDEDVSNEVARQSNRMYARAIQDAGGTMPKFGPDGPIRPRPEVDDDDEDDEDEGRLDRDDDLNFDS